MPPTVLQLSDLHLGRMPEHETQRCAIIADAVRNLAPDLAVISGDLCDDAPNHPGQIEQLGKKLVDAIANAGTPIAVIPGNHDVGNKPGIKNDALTPQRYDRWQKTFGHGWFRHDLADKTCTHDPANPWTVLGLNSQILGSGWDAEKTQYAWLDEQLATCDRCIVFMHMPPELPPLTDVTETQRQNANYWPVDPAPRKQLLQRLSTEKVRLLCSGHLHNDAAFPDNTPPRRWCPSLSFGVTIPGITRDNQGDRIGVLRHQLDNDHIVSTLIPINLPTANPMTL